MEQQPVGGAFQRPPRMAQYFNDQVQNMEAAQQNPQPQPQQPEVPSQQPMTVTVPPARQRQGIMPQPAAPMQQSHVASPAVANSEPQESPVPLTSGASLEPDTKDYTVWMQQLEADRQAFAQREQQWQAAYQQQQAELEAARKAQAELDRYKQQEAIAQKYSSDEAFAGLESVDANDARRIMQMTADALYQPLAEERARMAEERAQWQKQLEQTQTYAQQQAQASQAVRMRDQLLAAHPDFFELYNDPKFRAYFSGREGKSSYTREQMAIAEYNAGNAAYIIDMVDKFKGAKPQAQDIQTVAPVQVAQSASVAPTPQTPTMTLADLNSMMHLGRLTPDQYRLELNKLRAAQPQPA